MWQGSEELAGVALVTGNRRLFTAVAPSKDKQKATGKRHRPSGKWLLVFFGFQSTGWLL